MGNVGRQGSVSPWSFRERALVIAIVGALGLGVVAALRLHDAVHEKPLARRVDAGDGGVKLAQ